MFYKVFFTIDTGYKYDDHIAIVSADSDSEAIDKVNKYLEPKLTYDDWVVDVESVQIEDNNILYCDV
jgi:hypothetical protein